MRKGDVTPFSFMYYVLPCKRYGISYMVTKFGSFWIDCSCHRGGRSYSNPSPINKKPSQGIVTGI